MNTIKLKKYFYYKVCLLSTLILLAAAAFIYGYFIEPYSISIEYVTIGSERFSQVLQGIRLVHLSDLHIDHLGQKERAVLEKVDSLKPDIIVITGDTAQWDTHPGQAIRFLEQLRANYGVFFVLGDADLSSGRYSCLFCHPGGNYHVLRRHPVFLRNKVLEIKGPRGAFFVGGLAPDIEDAEEARKIIDGFLRQAGGKPLLLLSHFPRNWPSVPSSKPVLMLSGDTHGGQIWLPSLLWRIAGYRPVAGRAGIAGLFSKGRDSFLYISPGIGTTRRFPLRIGVPPRIAFFHFRPGTE